MSCSGFCSAGVLEQKALHGTAQELLSLGCRGAEHGPQTVRVFYLARGQVLGQTLIVSISSFVGLRNLLRKTHRWQALISDW